MTVLLELLEPVHSKHIGVLREVASTFMSINLQRHPEKDDSSVEPDSVVANFKYHLSGRGAKEPSREHRLYGRTPAEVGTKPLAMDPDRRLIKNVAKVSIGCAGRWRPT